VSNVQVHNCQYQLIKGINYTEKIEHQGQETLTGKKFPCTKEVT